MKKIFACILAAALLASMLLLAACDRDAVDTQSTAGSSGTQSSASSVESGDSESASTQSSGEDGTPEPSQSVPAMGEDASQATQSTGAADVSQPTQSTVAPVIQDDRFVPDACQVLFGTWTVEVNGSVGRWIFGVDGSFWQIANSYDGTEKIMEGVYYVADGQLYMGPGWDGDLSGAEFTVSGNQLTYLDTVFIKESDSTTLPA